MQVLVAQNQELQDDVQILTRALELKDADVVKTLADAEFNHSEQQKSLMAEADTKLKNLEQTLQIQFDQTIQQLKARE